MDRSEQQFERLFRDYFEILVSFAMKFTSGDVDDAKEIVHKVFIKVWEKYQTLPEDTNFKSYLYTSVNNLGLNHIRDRKKFIDMEQTREMGSLDEDTMDTEELQRNIELGLNTLPERCRQVFELSRFEGLKYQQIADKMGISVKTVEAQMSKALKLMKDHLKDYLVVLWLFLIKLLG